MCKTRILAVKLSLRMCVYMSELKREDTHVCKYTPMFVYMRESLYV